MTAPETDPAPRLASAEALIARAYAMEVEAAERYEDCAAQMELHGNLEVARLFHDLAAVERRHADSMADELARRGIRPARHLPLAAPGQEGLETGAADALHYLMTPYHALAIALENERRAASFFAELAESAPSDEIRELARGFAHEELMHVEMVRRWLARLPEPTEDWAYDPDDPRMPE